MFFGRANDLNEIGAYLHGNQSVSIVAPRKIGKTSLMLHLMRPKTMAALGIGKGNLFTYVDCQALSASRQDEIFASFCIEIAAVLHTRGLEPEPSLKAAVSTPTWSAFEFALRKLGQRGLRVVLMLDEFEQLTMNPHVDVGFYNALRSAAGRLRLVFLTASAQPLIELTYFDSSKKILSSPFFNIFAQLYLGLLSETEARELIRTPMESAGTDVSSQLQDFIYQLVGGHPLALQIACFHAWESPEDLPKIEMQTIQELEAHFQYYWHNLSPFEQDVLRHPAEAGLQEGGNPSLAVVLSGLTRKCLLVRSGGSYSHPSKAWAEFVSAHPITARFPSFADEMTKLEKPNQPAPGIDQHISQPPLEAVQPVETQPTAPRTTSPSSSHLASRPGSNLIVTVTSVEAQAVLGAFSLQQKWSRKKIGGKTFYDLGIHGGAPVFMVQSEMGIATPGGSLLTVHQAIQCLQPQAVIMCGIAFGLRPDKQKLGDILIAKQLEYYEPAKVVGIQTGNISRGDRVTASNQLLERFRDADIDWAGPQRHFGLVLSGEKLVNDPDFLKQLRLLEPDAIGGEMEGAGLYVAASEEKVDWILVKAICDWADGSKNDSAQVLAANNAANFVLYALQLGD
jgi:nucleoside phosphorylase